MFFRHNCWLFAKRIILLSTLYLKALFYMIICTEFFFGSIFHSKQFLILAFVYFFHVFLFALCWLIFKRLNHREVKIFTFPNNIFTWMNCYAFFLPELVFQLSNYLLHNLTNPFTVCVIIELQFILLRLVFLSSSILVLLISQYKSKTLC